jgi:hypothetical protein
MAETMRTHDEITTTARPFAAMSVVRTILTLAGAAALFVCAFQVWINGAKGDTLAFEAYWRMNPATDVNFWRSAALVPLGCAVLGVIGLITLSGWITRLAGVIAIVAFGMIVVELMRADVSMTDAIGAGLWWMLAGGIVMLVGSLATSARSSSTSSSPS